MTALVATLVGSSLLGGFSGYWERPSYQDQYVGGYFDHNNPKEGFNDKGRGYPDMSNLGHNLDSDQWRN